MAIKIDMTKVKDINAIKDHDSKVLAAAVFYAEEGMYVVPIRPGGKALPGKSYNFNYAHASRNPKVMEKWFGHGGKYEGWNIGLATGRKDGTFVVDLDKHGEVDGLESFNGLVPEGYIFHGPIQSTPSGGKHLLFGWREYATSSTGKLGPGIDTRGGDSESCKGHIVVWPSLIDGIEYSWDHGGDVDPVPDWLIANMGKPLNRVGAGNRGNEYMGDGDVEDKFTLDQIAVMLDVIQPDELSYSEWLEIGQAIHSQHPGAEGLNLWDTWSAEGERYQYSECRSRWSGFNEGGAVRIGTLIFYAKQRGYELRAVEFEDPNKDQVEELVEELNKRFAIVPMGSDIMVVEEVDVPEEVRRIQPRYRIFRKQGFKNLMENQYIITTNKKGEVVKTPHGDVWLGHENRRTYPSGMGLFPGKPQRYQGYYNIWGGFSIEPQPGNWDLFKSHIRDIICYGDDELYNWVLDWLADLYQDPANPKGCAIVMNGIEGCGKGTFAQMVGEVFGTGFKHITDEEHLIGRFNGHMMDCILAFADEVTYGGNRKVAGKLKSLVSEKFITAERKGIDAIQYHNCAHLLVASNESWFIPAGPQSRRWLVLDVAGDKANERTYFDQIHRQMEQEGGLGAMLHELLQREITSNLKKAPETDALYEQRSQYASVGSVEAWWSHQLATGVLMMPPFEAEDGNDPWPKRVTKADALNSYADWSREARRKTVSEVIFFKKMKAFGLSLTRFRTPGDRNKRVPGYRVPQYDVALKVAKTVAGMDLSQEEEEHED